jgi:hypothetical protein
VRRRQDLYPNKTAGIHPAQQAVILSTYVKSGVLTINEARAQDIFKGAWRR